MKKSLSIIAGLLSFIGSAQTGPSFTVTNTNGSNVITCSTPSLNYVANGVGNLTYVWTGPSSAQIGSGISIGTPGNYTVTASDTANNSSTYIFTVVMNNFVPNTSISPTLTNITCTMTSQVSFTANTSSANCTHQFLSPYGGTVFSQNTTAIYSPVGPGIYTLVTIDNSNGCSSTKQFTITSNVCFPALICSSPQNFSLGCTTNSTAVVSIITTTTLCAPSGPNSYTIIGPPTSTVVNFGTLSNISNYTVTAPGTWTVIARDNVSGCEINVPISITQNTTAPAISLNVPQQLLTCHVPQIILNGSSSSPNTAFIWSVPGTSTTISSPSLTVNSITASPTSTYVGTYTLNVIDNGNSCQSNTIIPIYQNIFKPNALMSSGGNYTLNVSTPSIVLVNVSNTGIPPSSGFPTQAPVIGYEWHGPAPQFSLSYSSTYTASTPGTYTLIAKDLNNGCINSVTLTILDGKNLVGTHQIESGNFYIKLFPNPNNGRFTLQTENAIENSCLMIYNALGVLVKKEEIHSNLKSVEIENEPNGIYMIQVFSKEKMIFSYKFIKE